MDLDELTWVPPEERERLRQLMQEWTGPGKGYIFFAVPPTPESEGLTFFQPCVDKKPREVDTKKLS